MVLCEGVSKGLDQFVHGYEPDRQTPFLEQAGHGIVFFQLPPFVTLEHKTSEFVRYDQVMWEGEEVLVGTDDPKNGRRC